MIFSLACLLSLLSGSSVHNQSSSYWWTFSCLKVYIQSISKPPRNNADFCLCPVILQVISPSLAIKCQQILDSSFGMRPTIRSSFKRQHTYLQGYHVPAVLDEPHSGLESKCLYIHEIPLLHLSRDVSKEQSHCWLSYSNFAWIN